MRGNQTGAALQEVINFTNDVYERLGIACITRKAIPGKYLRGGATTRSVSIPPSGRISIADLRNSSNSGQENPRRFIPESKAEPDYGGTIAPDGRAIFYDAKTTKREVLDFDNLHAHQIEFLERAGRMGAFAGFLVEFSAHKEIYFLPIQIVTTWRDYMKRRSIPYSVFTESLISAPSSKQIPFDYLATLKALYASLPAIHHRLKATT